MVSWRIIITLGVFLHVGNAVLAAETRPLAKELEVFRPYLDKTWQGQLSEPGKPLQMDVSHWQRALNGQAIKITHSVNQGVYGGETILFFDKKTQSLKYYYFTTAGFYTHGTMTFDAGSGFLVAEELVENNQQGITKVRSVNRLTADSLQVTSEYLQKGKWVPGHQVSYQSAPAASVVFQ